MSKIYHYLNEVWKEQSFSKAAKKLYVSQPSLSITIRNYEEELGIQIFDRSSYPIQLTNAGKVYMDGVQRILAIEQELAAYIDDTRLLMNGSLTVGAANLFATYLLPIFIDRFSEKYPAINLNFKEMDMFTLQGLVLKGEVDLIVESSEFDKEQFESCPLTKESMLLAVPATDPANQLFKDCSFSVADVLEDKHLNNEIPAVPMETFRDHGFIILEKGHDARERTFQICRSAGFTPRIVMVLNQLMTAYSMANRQIGCTLVSDTLVKMVGPRNSILLYKISQDISCRNINFIYKKNRYITKVMRAFMDMTIDLCAGGMKDLF